MVLHENQIKNIQVFELKNALVKGENECELRRRKKNFNMQNLLIKERQFLFIKVKK